MRIRISISLELSSFLDPTFKLNYVSDAAEVIEEVERQMRGLIEPLDSSSVDNASHIPFSSQPSSSGMEAPPAKKAKGLSKVLGRCLGNSQSVSSANLPPPPSPTTS